MEGKIIKNISNAYTVLCDNKEYVCTPRGVFRNKNITPLVGDICKIDEKNNIITEIMPRKNVLDRPSVSNVTYALLVTSLKKPSLSLNLLDREITSVILSNIKPVICFTKLDLLNDTEKKELNNIINYFNIFLLVLVFSISNEILGFPYLGILGQIKEVKDSTWYASLFYLSLLLLFLFLGMVNVLNLILLLLGTNIVSLLFRLWFIKKSLSLA